MGRHSTLLIVLALCFLSRELRGTPIEKGNTNKDILTRALIGLDKEKSEALSLVLELLSDIDLPSLCQSLTSTSLAFSTIDDVIARAGSNYDTAEHNAERKRKRAKLTPGVSPKDVLRKPFNTRRNANTRLPSKVWDLLDSHSYSNKIQPPSQKSSDDYVRQSSEKYSDYAPQLYPGNTRVDISNGKSAEGVYGSSRLLDTSGKAGERTTKDDSARDSGAAFSNEDLMAFDSLSGEAVDDADLMLVEGRQSLKPGSPVLANSLQLQSTEAEGHLTVIKGEASLEPLAPKSAERLEQEPYDDDDNRLIAIKGGKPLKPDSPKSAKRLKLESFDDGYKELILIKDSESLKPDSPMAAESLKIEEYDDDNNVDDDDDDNDDDKQLSGEDEVVKFIADGEDDWMEMTPFVQPKTKNDSAVDAFSSNYTTDNISSSNSTTSLFISEDLEVNEWSSSSTSAVPNINMSASSTYPPAAITTTLPEIRQISVMTDDAGEGSAHTIINEERTTLNQYVTDVNDDLTSVETGVPVVLFQPLELNQQAASTARELREPGPYSQPSDKGTAHTAPTTTGSTTGTSTPFNAPTQGVNAEPSDPNRTLAEDGGKLHTLSGSDDTLTQELGADKSLTNSTLTVRDEKLQASITSFNSTERSAPLSSPTQGLDAETSSNATVTTGEEESHTSNNSSNSTDRSTPFGTSIQKLDAEPSSNSTPSVGNEKPETSDDSFTAMDTSPTASAQTDSSTHSTPPSTAGLSVDGHTNVNPLGENKDSVDRKGSGNYGYGVNTTQDTELMSAPTTAAVVNTSMLHVNASTTEPASEAGMTVLKNATTLLQSVIYAASFNISATRGDELNASTTESTTKQTTAASNVGEVGGTPGLSNNSSAMMESDATRNTSPEGDGNHTSSVASPVTTAGSSLQFEQTDTHSEETMTDTASRLITQVSELNTSLNTPSEKLETSTKVNSSGDFVYSTEKVIVSAVRYSSGKEENSSAAGSDTTTRVIPEGSWTAAQSVDDTDTTTITSVSSVPFNPTLSTANLPSEESSLSASLNPKLSTILFAESFLPVSVNSDLSTTRLPSDGSFSPVSFNPEFSTRLPSEEAPRSTPQLSDRARQTAAHFHASGQQADLSVDPAMETVAWGEGQRTSDTRWSQVYTSLRTKEEESVQRLTPSQKGRSEEPKHSSLRKKKDEIVQRLKSSQKGRSEEPKHISLKKEDRTVQKLKPSQKSDAKRPAYHNSLGTKGAEEEKEEDSVQRLKSSGANRPPLATQEASWRWADRRQTEIQHVRPVNSVAAATLSDRDLLRSWYSARFSHRADRKRTTATGKASPSRWHSYFTSTEVRKLKNTNSVGTKMDSFSAWLPSTSDPTDIKVDRRDREEVDRKDSGETDRRDEGEVVDRRDDEEVVDRRDGGVVDRRDGGVVDRRDGGVVDRRDEGEVVDSRDEGEVVDRRDGGEVDKRASSFQADRKVPSIRTGEEDEVKDRRTSQTVSRPYPYPRFGQGSSASHKRFSPFRSHFPPPRPNLGTLWADGFHHSSRRHGNQYSASLMTNSLASPSPQSYFQPGVKRFQNSQDDDDDKLGSVGTITYDAQAGDFKDKRVALGTWRRSQRANWVEASPYDSWKAKDGVVRRLRSGQAGSWSDAGVYDKLPPRARYEGYACPGLFGFFGDPVDCHSFFICSWGVPYRFFCPSGTLWNPSRSVCDWSRDVLCPN